MYMNFEKGISSIQSVYYDKIRRKGFMKRILCFMISATLLISSIYVYPIYAVEMRRTASISTGDYLTPEEAKCFMGFLFSTSNLSDEQLNRNDMFKLMTGQLSGQEEEYAGLQFIQFMNARLTEMSKKLGNINDYSSQFLIDYLANRVNQGAYGNGLASDIVNSTLKDISGQFQNYIYSEYLISGHGLENMEYEYFQDGMLDAKKWENLKSISSKVEEYKKQILALSNAIFYATSTNREEM